MIYNCIASFNPRDDSLRWMLLLSPFFRLNAGAQWGRPRIYSLNLSSLIPEVTLHHAEPPGPWSWLFPVLHTYRFLISRYLESFPDLQCKINTSVLPCRIWLRLELNLTFLLLHSPDSAALRVSPKSTSWEIHLHTIFVSGSAPSNTGYVPKVNY